MKLKDQHEKLIAVGFVALLFAAHPFVGVAAQENEAEGDYLDYHLERQITLAGNHNPLWLNANKQGLSSLKESNGYLRGGLFGQKTLGHSGDWHARVGADLAVAYNFTSSFIIQQLYGELSFRKFNLTIGSKERPMMLKNNELSTGSQTFGINARPIPEVRFETSDYVNLLPHSNLLGIRFEFGYGMTTDGRWQKHFVTAGRRYTSNILYHTQSGFLRVGDEKKFPLVFEAGLEWACQFGGTIHNINSDGTGKIKMSHNFKDFYHAIYGGGSDPTDGVYNGAEGNTLGSWLFSLSYKLPNEGRARIYYDHFFEDHSQLFLQYGWKDGLYGLELTLPRNPAVGTVVYEYLNTRDQSGPIYHDHTAAVPDQISAADNYYNHSLYSGWQHWGRAVGNPLFVGPLWNGNHELTFPCNRLRAHHIGLSGDPLRSLHYRLLYTYEEGWGTYEVPFSNKKYGTSFLAEVGFSPRRIGRWNVSGNTVRLGFGFDKGNLRGSAAGFQLTFLSNGHLIKK